MFGKIGSFFKNLGPGGDYMRAPGALHDMAEAAPAPVLGAGAGGALGAVAGFGVGLHNLMEDRVSIVTQRTEFLRPELVGAKYIPEDCTTQFTYDDKGNISGSYQTCDSPYFRPLIENRSTGLIESRQKFVHTMSVGPLAGAAIGLGVGAVSGAVVGLLAQKLADPQVAPHSAQRGNRAPLIGAGIGAVVGGGAGFLAGHVAQSRAQTLTETIRTPVTTEQHIGWVPYAREYSNLRPQMDGSRQIFYTDTNLFSGQRDVVRDVPTGDYRAHTETTTSYHLSPLAGAALGVGIGVVAGGLGGVAVGVLNKLLDS